MTVAPLHDGRGRVTHFAGHHRDAGERLRIDPKQARDSLSGAHQPTALAIRDDRLTGLFTLPYLQEFLKRDWTIAQREQRSIAVFAIDIDALDLYNGTFGRAAGDSTIRRVAHCVSGCLRRSSDVTARIEGGSLMAFAPGLHPGPGAATRPADGRTRAGAAHPSSALRDIALRQRERRRVCRHPRSRRQSGDPGREIAAATEGREEARAQPGCMRGGALRFTRAIVRRPGSTFASGLLAPRTKALPISPGRWSSTPATAMRSSAAGCS